MALATQDLIFAYNKQNRFQFPDIQLEDNEHLLILGPSGKGKTTLLHLLGGILRPSEGRIVINKKDIAKLPASQLDRFRGRNIGIVFQRSYFVKSLSVKDNLLLALKLAGQSQSEAAVKEILDEMNLLPKLNSRPAELSLGEQQRASIARATLCNPALLLADEPTSALDDENARIVAELLLKTAERHHANLVVVTHDHRLKSSFTHFIEL